VASPERFSVLASLAPVGGFRRVLALDRAGAARAVVIAFAPAALADDPARLAALLRDAEAAARLHHPAAAAVLGTETIGGELAIVELHRPGATLRALLDAGGRLPPELAARAILDACAALRRAHSMDGGDGRPLVHGALAPARVVIGEDGMAFVSGLGLVGGSDPVVDVRALGAVLFECLTGEAPGFPPRPLDVPGVPTALAAIVDRAIGAAAPPLGSAAELAEGIASAISPAPHAAVAAYADAILPEDEGERAELRRTLASALVGGQAEEISADLIVDPTDPAVAAPAVAPAVGRMAPPRGPDAAGTFPKPPPPARGSRLPLAVGAVCLVAGFAFGFSLARSPSGTWPALLAIPAAREARTAATATSTPAPAPARAPPEPEAATPAPTPPAAEPKRTPAKRVAAPARATKPGRESAGESSRPGAGKGNLDVSAPEDADVFLDGRRVGRGSVRLEIAEGAHRIEVRRAGASIAERFTLEPGETWTYTVTPEP
jgi:hypothetical protein